MTTTLLVLAAVLLVIGSLQWLQPSRSEQHQAKLRQAALSEGFKLRSLSVRDLSDSGMVEDLYLNYTLYCLLHGSKPQNQSQCVIRRTQRTPGVGLDEGWEWEDQRRCDEMHLPLFRQFLQQSGQQIEALVVEADCVGVVLKESGCQINDLEAIKTRLNQLQQTLRGERSKVVES